MKYTCIYCNYTTQYNSNWFKHIRTKIHAINLKLNMNMSPEINCTKNENPAKIHNINSNSDMETRINNIKTEDQTKIYTINLEFDTDVSSETSCDDIENEANILTENKKYKCNDCGYEFTNRQSLSRHKKRCNEAEKNEKDEKIKYLENSNEYLKLLVEKVGNVATTAVKTIKNMEKTNLVAMKTAKTSISALNYVITNYTNAPVLEPMPHYKAINDYSGDSNIAIGIISLYENCKLTRFLCDMIVNNYKKSNPEEQSVWNTDNSRWTYIIRTIVGNSNGWIADKKGIKLRDVVINPLLSHIEKELWNFVQNQCDDNDSKESPTEKLHKLHLCMKVLEDIRNSVLAEDLVKELGQYFQLLRYDKSSLEQIE